MLFREKPKQKRSIEIIRKTEHFYKDYTGFIINKWIVNNIRKSNFHLFFFWLTGFFFYPKVQENFPKCCRREFFFFLLGSLRTLTIMSSLTTLTKTPTGISDLFRQTKGFFWHKAKFQVGMPLSTIPIKQSAINFSKATVKKARLGTLKRFWE